MSTGSKTQYLVRAKICGNNTTNKGIFCQLVVQDKRSYQDKIEIILTQINTCEILLENTNDHLEEAVIQRKIMNIYLTLVINTNNHFNKTEYGSLFEY